VWGESLEGQRWEENYEDAGGPFVRPRGREFSEWDRHMGGIALFLSTELGEYVVGPKVGCPVDGSSSLGCGHRKNRPHWGKTCPKEAPLKRKKRGQGGSGKVTKEQTGSLGMAGDNGEGCGEDG